MKDIVEVKELEEMYERGEIKGCMVGGFFVIDNVVFLEVVKYKGINYFVVGRVDILLVLDIEGGNILYKVLVFFLKLKNVGVIVGVKVLIILIFRVDSEEIKLNLIVLGVLMVVKV